MRPAGMLGACLLLAACVLPTTSVADTFTVSPDGLGDYPTIQAAVDGVEDGDEIVLASGVFSGAGNWDVEVPSKSITVRSESGNPVDCIIECGGGSRAAHRGFHFTSTGDGLASLSGVAVMNGRTDANGAGIWIDGASPSITNCAAVNCAATGTGSRGGGLYVSGGGSPIVTDCIFSGNSAWLGGGIAVYDAMGSYVGCDIIDNDGDTGGGFYGQFSGYSLVHLCDISSNTAARGGGVRWAGSGGSALSFCTIARNEADELYGGGIWLQSGTVSSCSFIENSAAMVGGGIYCQAGTGTVTDCLVAYSEAGGGVAAYDVSNVPSLSCCDVYGNVGGNYDGVVGDQTGSDGNISQDPRLCDIASGDYSLDYGSPCLPGNNGCSVLIGAIVQGCDTPVKPSSWGHLKGMYR